MSTSNADPFDDLLTLEDRLHSAAYAQGTADAARQGRIQGRVFGLQNGFDKFVALGQLHGRAVVWGARLPRSSQADQTEERPSKLPVLEPNRRLEKHIQMLHALSDPHTFSTLNTEDAVADFDDRYRRAGAKAKMVERIVAESAVLPPADGRSPETAGPSLRVREAQRQKKRSDNMEDFKTPSYLL